MKVMVTGSAGFIGYHLAERLLARGDRVVGVDNLNDYYDVSLKQARLERLAKHAGFDFRRLDIADRAAMDGLFAEHRFDAVVNLAAQAGVRYSLKNPQAYVDANVTGFLNILEGVRHTQPQAHLVYASTSSVYGLNTAMPFAETQTADHPVSFYAATKRANELMAHSYAHLFGLKCTGLRFFTVYGPWGRPDMALFLFTKAMLEGKPINLFNEGRMIRDFTYVDDIVEGVMRIADHPATPDAAWSGEKPNPGTSPAPWRVYNIGNNQRIELMRYVRAIEAELGMKAQLNLMPMQAGDVEATEADTTALSQAVGFKPATPVEEGVARFVRWYRDFYRAGG
ncbi:MAG: NAD-dependent epimerase [Betaproteobacteria bacterium]|nr:NAD-dependent epimerase [Betaproteobacteria bacterium]